MREFVKEVQCQNCGLTYNVHRKEFDDGTYTEIKDEHVCTQENIRIYELEKKNKKLGETISELAAMISSLAKATEMLSQQQVKHEDKMEGIIENIDNNFTLIGKELERIIEEVNIGFRVVASRKNTIIKL